MSLTDHGSSAVRSRSRAASTPSVATVIRIGASRSSRRKRSTSSRPKPPPRCPRPWPRASRSGPDGGQDPRNRAATGVGAGPTVQSTRHRPRPDRGRPTRGRRPGRTRPMTQTAPTPIDRPHRAAEALHLRLGRRPGRRRRDDARPARRQGCGPGRDDQRRPPGPARLHDHDRGVQRLLHRRRAAARRAVGRRPRGRPRGRAPDRQGLRQRRGSAPRVGPLGRQVLDARDDGHRAQPGPQRGDPPRPGRADRQRALRLGCLPPLHPDVRADRHGREG